MSNEFVRIAEIARRLRRDSADVLVGIGDDAAVLRAGDSPLVVSVDAAVQGVHFRPELVGWRDTGFRSLVAALSDLAAMGAGPRAALLALILPDGFQDGLLYELIDGLAEAADCYGCPVIGGNLSCGAEVSITTAVMGQAPDRVLTREGARPDDYVYVTGTLGDAALGLRCLQAGRTKGAEAFAERWRRPVARVDEGRKLTDKATAAVDISDGLLLDLGHLCQASGVGARLDASALPLEEGFRRLAKELGCDPVRLALSGGEQYELVFTAPAQAQVQGLGTRIGRVVAGSRRVEVFDEQGRPIEIEEAGYTHWRNR
jgi:thiamine-monophosphate kinase